VSRVAAALCGAQLKSFLQGLKPDSRHQVTPGLKPRPSKEKAKDKSPKKVLKISAQKTNAQRKGFKKAPKASAQRERLKEDASRKRLMQALALSACENDPKALWQARERDGCDGLGQQGGGN
jgi:hypothetical protein